MSDSSPNVVVVAGPNGSGKSTAAPSLLRDYLGLTEFVNADVIAQGLAGFHAEAVAIQAGRIMRARLRELASQRIDFAFETTLASRSFAPWLRELRDSGYRVHLPCVWSVKPVPIPGYRPSGLPSFWRPRSSFGSNSPSPDPAGVFLLPGDSDPGWGAVPLTPGLF